MSGRVVSLHVADAASVPMKSVMEVRAWPGRGLEGDRYFRRAGTFSAKDGADREITFIETEALEALHRDYGVALEALHRDYGVALEPEETRRNVATRGVPLNHFVGRVFRVGGATARGLRLCEPCSHMERLSGKPIRAGLVHRGGLRARLLSEGLIRVGDEVTLLDAAEPPG
jgi:MOSC domain-containing protein YiiM